MGWSGRRGGENGRWNLKLFLFYFILFIFDAGEQTQDVMLYRYTPPAVFFLFIFEAASLCCPNPWAQTILSQPPKWPGLKVHTLYLVIMYLLKRYFGPV
jgi:hypothetical protein